MIRIWSVMIAAAWLLAGCASSPSRAVFPRHYELTGMAAAPARPSPTVARRTIRVDAVGAPGWLDGTAMHYRLAYRDDHQVAAYAESDWVAPPPRMLSALVRRALADSGHWRIVVGPGDPAATDFVLRIRLDGFGQVFTGPAESYGTLDLTATLTGGNGERALAQRRFSVRSTAPTADAAGGAAALNTASAQFTAELRTWLAATVAALPASQG